MKREARGSGEASAADTEGDRSDAPGDDVWTTDTILEAMIVHAFSRRPLRSAKWWYSTLTSACERNDVAPPSLHAFEKRMSAERARRRDERLAACDRAVEKVMSIVGEGTITIVEGAPPVDARDCAFVVETIMRRFSSRVGEGYWEYLDLARRAAGNRMSKDVFRELVVSPPIVEAVAAEFAPTWWTSAVERRRRLHRT